jgi:hypothetical protein
MAVGITGAGHRGGAYSSCCCWAPVWFHQASYTHARSIAQDPASDCYENDSKIEDQAGVKMTVVPSPAFVAPCSF